MTITPIHPYVGARADGVDLGKALDEPTFRAIFEAFQEYSVLVFPDQRLTDEQQMAFSERFGPLETTIRAIGREDRLSPHLVDLSNIDPDHDVRSAKRTVTCLRSPSSALLELRIFSARCLGV